MTDEQPQTAGAQDEQERARVFREQLKRLHAADLGYEMSLSLVSFGSQKLGLTDGTAELRDLDDARLSIELLRALLDVLERQQGGGVPASELRDTLAQLQLAYAHAVQLETARAAAEEATPAAPAAEAASEPSGGEDEAAGETESASAAAEHGSGAAGSESDAAAPDDAAPGDAAPGNGTPDDAAPDDPAAT